MSFKGIKYTQWNIYFLGWALNLSLDFITGQGWELNNFELTLYEGACITPLQIKTLWRRVLNIPIYFYVFFFSSISPSSWFRKCTKFIIQRRIYVKVIILCAVNFVGKNKDTLLYFSFLIPDMILYTKFWKIWSCGWKSLQK